MSVYPLHQLAKHQQAYIKDIIDNPVFGSQDRSVSLRLAELGFSSHRPVTIIAKGLLGKGSYVVRLDNHSQFSLRKAEAEKILCYLK
ncbi:iron transporter [Gallibacterium genomosp. 3]|uniref:Iron transporter n=1 Tax=Gallibacterium genomosp. 3 TaxID=505345 RepID=A0A1A7PS99_9PAST|nr:FeoA family protein [Gallibacterium genomosp. 3]OBX04602.1 iron transporter [Gallibacterium genomosp. 3]